MEEIKDTQVESGQVDSTDVNVEGKTKFCKHCGKKINTDAVLCIHCGLQVEELKSAQPQVVVNNTNTNTNTNANTNTAAGMPYGIKPKNKWVALLLCLVGYVGFAGIHKFYEKKILLGIVYLITFGFIGIGTTIDAVILLFKPNPYY